MANASMSKRQPGHLDRAMDESRPGEPPKGPIDLLDLRRHPRMSLSWLVQYRFDVYEGYRVEYATDLSQGGLFVETDQPHPPGAVVQIQLTPRHGGPLIEGLGRVVRRVGPGDAEASGMGIEFIHLDPETREELNAQLG
ncbi:MAG: PilZ domain-containing protein [Deltaproteobacteria bacterium]